MLAPPATIPESQAAAESESAGGRLSRWLLLLIYLLLILEGVLRKWVLPEYSRALFFARDPLVLLLYTLALRRGARSDSRSRILHGGIVLAIAALALALLQAASSELQVSNRWLLAAYGWRNYFLYLPLPFVMRTVMTSQDLALISRWTPWLAVPVALLVTAQFLAPPTAAINVGSGQDPTQQFRGLAADETHTRPMGTFTSDVGQKEFVVSTIAILLALWVRGPGGSFPGRVETLMGTIAAMACLAVSGSRGMALHVVLVLLMSILGAVAVRQRQRAARTLLVPALLCAAAVIVIPLLFADGFQVFVNRWNTAYESEKDKFSGGIFGRALYGFIDFMRLLADTPLAGYGLGLGGNASTLVGETIQGKVPIEIAETDWARHIVDLGPILGLLFIFYRLSLVIWLGWQSFAAARRGNDPLPWFLFSFVAIELLTGQITGQGTINGYVWFFSGVTLAAARVATLRADEARRPASPQAIAQFTNLMS